jgi:AAA domain
VAEAGEAALLNVCWGCGLYRADKIIDPQGPFAICPECGHRHAFRQLPLLVVSGASAAGKTVVCQALLGRLPEAVLLDADILWRPEFDTPQDNYRAFFEIWLRLCKNIGQAGRPVVIFGAGMGVPANLKSCVERRYLGPISYLALTCEPDMLAERLRQRPAWRGGGPAFIEAQIRFNRWFQLEGRQTSPPIDLLDTTQASIAETTAAVAVWIRARATAAVS